MVVFICCVYNLHVMCCVAVCHVLSIQPACGSSTNMSTQTSMAIVECIIHLKRLIGASTGVVLQRERLGGTFRWQKFNVGKFGEVELPGLHCVLDEQLPLYDGRDRPCRHHNIYIYIYISVRPPRPAPSCPARTAPPAPPTPPRLARWGILGGGATLTKDMDYIHKDFG